ncbi:MAG: hypothetical protein OXJ90_13500 [Spirochaetaceae bacterium]|nr:hypothetical protein [Spirochaetaceae bacterium]
MIDEKLRAALRSLVSRYGFEQVDRSLREIRMAATGPDRPKEHSEDATAPRGPKTVRHPISAQEYVAKMDHEPGKLGVISEVAKRFEEKSFLPSFGDIRNFCQVYGIDEPASKSRASAIPRVFKFIATMSYEEVLELLHDEMFSGPSRVGPIADAIREIGRAASLRDRRMKAG